jgi:hypothetical protein
MTQYLDGFRDPDLIMRTAGSIAGHVDVKRCTLNPLVLEMVLPHERDDWS